MERKMLLLKMTQLLKLLSSRNLKMTKTICKCKNCKSNFQNNRLSWDCSKKSCKGTFMRNRNKDLKKSFGDKKKIASGLNRNRKWKRRPKHSDTKKKNFKRQRSKKNAVWHWKRHADLPKPRLKKWHKNLCKRRLRINSKSRLFRKLHKFKQKNWNNNCNKLRRLNLMKFLKESQKVLLNRVIFRFVC